jgi:serine/threonine protein kinase
MDSTSADTDLPAIPGYEVRRRIGQGGMGIVYEARRLSDGRWVALKMIVGTHPQLKQRFRREVSAIARLRHPNIVELYDTGEHGGWPFFTMELVAGGTLAEQRHRFDGDLAAGTALVERLARAVDHAHELGIVHRDLKPGNVLLGVVASPRDAIAEPASERLDYVPKISDFGLAKCLDAEDSLTNTSAIMGTPAYMAPEVARGEMRDAGPAVDVYALGAILYELLTGQVPFRGSTLEVLDRIRSAAPVSPRALRPEIPPGLESICLRCLEKTAKARPGSARHLADELLGILQGGLESVAVAAPPGSPTTSAPNAPPTEPHTPAEPSTQAPVAPSGDPLPAIPGYEVVELAGRGSLSDIYRARQTRLRRVVALRLPSRLKPGDQVAERFRIEAEVLSALQHPNILQLFDAGEHDGRPFLVHEFLDGGTLAARLKRGPMDEGDAVALTATLARAAHHLHHALGHLVIHRNINPTLVMYTAAGVPKLVGFGLVHAPALGTAALEPDGSLVGTPSFMAPEQVRGNKDEYGPGTDVYGLGATLYKMLTGRPPGGAITSLQDIQRALNTPPTPPRQLNPKVSRRVEAVCLKALAKDAYDRHASAQELAEELEQARKGWFG